MNATLNRFLPYKEGDPNTITDYDIYDNPDGSNNYTDTEDIIIIIERHSERHTQENEGFMGHPTRSLLVDFDLDVSANRHGTPDTITMKDRDDDTTFVYRVIQVEKSIHPLRNKVKLKRVFVQAEEVPTQGESSEL